MLKLLGIFVSHVCETLFPYLILGLCPWTSRMDLYPPVFRPPVESAASSAI